MEICGHQQGVPGPRHVHKQTKLHIFIYFFACCLALSLLHRDALFESHVTQSDVKIKKDTVRKKTPASPPERCAPLRAVPSAKVRSPSHFCFRGCLGFSEPVHSTDKTGSCLSWRFCKLPCTPAREFYVSRLPVMLPRCACGGHGVPWSAGPEGCPSPAAFLRSPRASSMLFSLRLRLAHLTQASAFARWSLSSRRAFLTTTAQGPLCVIALAGLCFILIPSTPLALL